MDPALFVLPLLFTLVQEPSDIHEMTVLPDGASFEIVQSQISARRTVRLDRFTGQVARLVESPNARFFDAPNGFFVGTNGNWSTVRNSFTGQASVPGIRVRHFDAIHLPDRR